MRRTTHSIHGSSLVTTLLVIVILAIIVTAFLQSMTAERQTSRSYLNQYRAELAAETAANAAENLMRKLFKDYPDSCTAWARLPKTEGTAFYFRTLPDSDTGSLPKDSGTSIKAIFLASGAVPVVAQSQFSEDTVFPKQTATGSEGLTSENSVNMNRNGWIGGQVGKAHPEIVAKWIDILEDPSRERDDTFDPSTRRPRNGLVARYAFWIEDESFRVNINESGAKPRGDSTRGADPEDIDLQSIMKDAETNNFAEALVTLRKNLPAGKFLSTSAINYADGSGASDAYQKLKFYITDTSSALNFSRGGVKRLNLNEVVSDEAEPETIRAELDRVIAAFGNKYAMPSNPSRKSLSDFGQRFYFNPTKQGSLNTFPVGTSSAYNHADIYMQKLAANIRDFIDEDSQPTIINNDPEFSVREIKKPNATDMIGFNPPGNGGSASDTIAVGKEAVPALQEYALRVRLRSMTPPIRTASQTSANYVVDIYHYFEFLNPTNRDIPVESLNGPGQSDPPFLLISNQFGFGTAGGDDIPAGRVMEIPLTMFEDGTGKTLEVFPAGKTTVLTTDPDPETTMADGVNVSTFYRVNSAGEELIREKTHFEGRTMDAKSSPRMFRLLAKAGTVDGRAGTGSTDYDTHVMIGNSSGVIESFTALPMPAALSVAYLDNQTTPPNPKTTFFRGGSLKGNNSGTIGVATGDPRSLNEQMHIQRYQSGVTNDITRFLDTNLDGGPKGTSTFGRFAYATYVDPTLWPDYVPKVVNDGNTAYARVASSKLDSIGRLGDIYDPSRDASSTGFTRIPYSRGGGRSLRIGQSELYANSSPGVFGFWDGIQTSVSRNRAAWRLADIFSTRSEVATPGVININGSSRDGGAALRAVFNELKFSSGSEDPGLSGKDLDVEELVKAIEARFPSGKSEGPTLSPSQDAPFWERGELSEVKEPTGSNTIFSQGSKLAGTEMGRVLDRGREELVRRGIELITTKGNTYRAYCIGEAVKVDRNGAVQVLSRQRLKVTFALEPVFFDELPADNAFDGAAELASEEDAPSKRFRQPDDFRVKILAVNTL